MKGMIVDFKQLKQGTKTVYEKKRVFIPVKVALHFSNHSYHKAAQEFLKTINVKTILTQVCGGDCKVDFPENEVSYMTIKKNNY